MKYEPKVSIITVVKNAEATITRCISSVVEQSYPNIEMIVVDGVSTDDTLPILANFKEGKLKVYSERDHGIYDALNKGISHASGDIIGLLHGDDYLANPEVIQSIVTAFNEKQVPILIGKLAYFHPKNRSQIVRKYYPSQFKTWMFRLGIAPPHPAFYVKREVFEKYGNYRTDLEIGGDFDLMLRLLYLHQLPYQCINQYWVMMSTGGKSTKGWRSILKNNDDIRKVCKDHHLRTNFLLIYAKYFLKLLGVR